MTKGISVLTIEGSAVASSVQELEAIHHSIFPVPAQDKFTVSVSDNADDYRFDLFDVTGRLVLSTVLGAGANAIDVSALGRGHHVYAISSSAGRASGGTVILQ
jgi:hypothetical protein